ncbi:hypothetical protein [Nocardia asteroides]
MEPLDEAVDRLVDALEPMGLMIDVPPGETGGTPAVDAYLTLPDGETLALVIKRVSLLSSKELPNLLRHWTTPVGPDRVVPIVIGSRITEEARTGLIQAGWSWLDLRGQLHLTAPGLFVHTAVAGERTAHRESGPFAGRVGVEVAALLLLDPHKPARIRKLAQDLRRAPSSVSAVVAGMRTAGLVDADNLPSIPELFWELAAAWKPESVDVAEIPTDDQSVEGALRVNRDDLGRSGWALSDTHAAAAYGAPIAARADGPPDLYVQDQRVLRRAVKLLGTAQHRTDRAATLRAAPLEFICHHRIGHRGSWPLAHPLFVALDLAQDPGRGREVLDLWNPPEGHHRVW